MALGVPAIVIDSAAPAYAQHLVTDVNDALNRIAGQALSALADASVTNAILADMAQATIKGRAAGAGTGVPTDLTGAQAYAISGGAAIASFTAHKNGSDQTGVTSATEIKITFTTEVYDIGGYYDAANSKWTPPVGKVQLTGRVLFNANIVDQSIYYAVIYKNGAALRYLNSPSASGTGSIGVLGSIDDDANGTDYYELYAFGGGAGDKTISGTASVTFFQGHMI